MGFSSGDAPAKPAEVGVDVPTEEEWEEIKDMTSDLATTLHRIASASMEPETIRKAINALVRHELMSQELQ